VALLELVRRRGRRDLARLLALELLQAAALVGLVALEIALLGVARGASARRAPGRDTDGCTAVSCGFSWRSRWRAA